MKKGTVMSDTAAIIRTILEHYPKTQAIYLFGTWGTENEWPDSDIEVAVLLPFETAKRIDSWTWIELSGKVAAAAGREKADLVNLRRANTVFQSEVIMAERRIHCRDEQAAAEFEMLVLSHYQKLNEERAEILEQGSRTGRFYDV